MIRSHFSLPSVMKILLFFKTWFFLGKVPALIDGSKVVVESLDICDYLDEKYPNNPLYPAEPEARAQDKELIKKIGPATQVFAECCFMNKPKSPEEWLKSFLEVLQVFEEALEKRGTKYFGGEKPGMVNMNNSLTTT